MAVRSANVAQLDNCTANAIYTAMEQDDLKPGHSMIVTYDQAAGLTRVAVYNTSWDILTTEIPGRPDEPGVKDSIQKLRETIAVEDMTVKYVECT